MATAEGSSAARRSWGAWSAFGGAYLALALGADWLTNQSSEFSTFWPAAGLYLGVLLLSDRRDWPGLAATAATASLLASAVIGRRPALAISGALADAVEALLGAGLVLAVLGGRPRMWRIRDLAAVAVLGAGFAAALASTLGGAAVALATRAPFLRSSVDWWVGDALGILVVAPLVVAWVSPDATEPSPVRQRPVELSALVLAAAGASWVIFRGAPQGRLGHEYLVLPVLVWAALRFGPRGASLTSVVLAVGGAWATAWASRLAGLTAVPPDSARVQLYVALATTTGLVLAAEVAARARTEAKLRLARFVIDQGAEAMLVCDGRGRVLLASEAAGRLLGRDAAALGGRDLLALDRELQAMAGAQGLASLAGRGELRYETVLEDAAGRRPPAEVHLAFLTYGGSRYVAWSARDLSERRRVEEDHRLAAVGTLASGVAHEINNPLTYVTASLAFVQESLERMRGAHPEVAAAEEAAADAVTGARRVRDIVRDLRFVARPADGRLVEIDPVQEIRSALTLAQAEIQRRAVLDLRLEPCPVVLTGQGRIGQVVLHLLVNAAQSIPAGSPATQAVRVSSGTDAEGWASIEVSDTGSGIPAHARGRIFEPFFSTRPVGGGAGLGLSVSHGIVTGMGGTIGVESEPSRGTTVRVRLPPAPPPGPEGEASSAPPG